MKSHLQALRANASLLRQELDLGATIQQDLARSGTKASIPVARRQAYVSGLISIYALLEQTVDDLLEAVVKSWSWIYVKHSDVDEAIRAEMRVLTLQALLDFGQGRGRIGLDEERALASILVTPEAPPTFEPFVATRKTANYRHPLVLQMLRRIGIEIDSGFDESVLASGLTASGFTQIVAFLEDLAERRNEMAHRMVSPDADLLQKNALLAYLEVVEAYLTELIRVIAIRMVERVSPRLNQVATCREAGNNYIAFNLAQGKLSIGDVLVFMKESRMSIHAVRSLQINGVPLRYVRVKGDPVDVGIGLAEGQNRRFKGSKVLAPPPDLVEVLIDLGVSPI